MGMPLQNESRNAGETKSARPAKKSAKKSSTKKRGSSKPSAVVVDIPGDIDEDHTSDRPSGYVRQRFSIYLDFETSRKLKGHFQRQSEVRTVEQLISNFIQEIVDDE